MFSRGHMGTVLIPILHCLIKLPVQVLVSCNEASCIGNVVCSPHSACGSLCTWLNSRSLLVSLVTLT